MKMSLVDRTACMRPGCTNGGRMRRGLCPSCYILAARLVAKKLTTWDKLVSEGRCDPVRRRSPANIARVKNWFLAGAVNNSEAVRPGRTP